MAFERDGIGHEEIRPGHSGLVAVGTLACPGCDAPVSPGDRPLRSDRRRRVPVLRALRPRARLPLAGDADAPGARRDPPARVDSLGVRRRQRERQRLGVGAGAQRLVGLDRLLEGDRRRRRWTPGRSSVFGAICTCSGCAARACRWPAGRGRRPSARRRRPSRRCWPPRSSCTPWRRRAVKAPNAACAHRQRERRRDRARPPRPSRPRSASAAGRPRVEDQQVDAAEEVGRRVVLADHLHREDVLALRAARAGRARPAAATMTGAA